MVHVHPALDSSRSCFLMDTWLSPVIQPLPLSPVPLQVILSLRQALNEAGASEEELASCLVPVDLAKEHQQYVRVEAA